MAQIANADPTKCTYKHKGRLIKKKKTSQAGCVGSQLGLPHFRNPKLARNAFITSCNTIPKQKRRKHRNLKQEKKQPCLPPREKSWKLRNKTRNFLLTINVMWVKIQKLSGLYKSLGNERRPFSSRITSLDHCLIHHITFCCSNLLAPLFIYSV